MSVQDQPAITSGEIPLPNLWEKALDTLGVELKNSLDLKTASRVNVLSKALKEAREKKQICVQKSWTFKNRNGETIIIRDVVEKIIVWVEKFIAVGDAAMQYDPVHSAPAWAAFRFILQMAVNDKRVFGETIENLEAVSRLITRYAILEELYLQRNSAARDKLEDMVVRLYAEILIFLANARKYFQSSAKVRLARSILKFSEDEQMAKINVLDGQISRLTEVFTVEIQINTAKEIAAMNFLLTSLNEPIKRLVDQSSISAQVLQESQHLQFLQWLSPVPFSRHHKRHSEARIPGSGQFLLDHDRYLGWRNTSSSSIFLLHGIAGSGKTSLVSAVIDSLLQESSGQASSAPVAYVYCTKNSAEAERSNPDEIMGSILRQLTVSHGPLSTVHKRVLQEYERRQAVAKVDGFDIARLQTAESARLILDTTAANPATIVLDAVDEIHPSSRHVLLLALSQIVQDSLSVVKVFVTSRDDSNINALLSNAVALRIRTEHTRKDMDKFVNQEFSYAIQNQKLLKGNVSNDLKQSLMSALIAGASESFIWMKRQIENLCRLKSEVDVRSAIRALPKNTLNDLYEEDIQRMSESGGKSRIFAITVFSILLSTQEALSPDALIQAMTKKGSKQVQTSTLAEMIDICFNLIVVDSELNVLRFAHISFQEFLESRAEFAPHYIHRVAAISCLDFCLEGLPVATENILSPKQNFHHYSAIYWAEHCRNTIFDGADDSITRKINEFVFDEGDTALGFVDWIQEVEKFTKILPRDHALAKKLYSVVHSDGNPLFTACVFGIATIIDELAHATYYDWDQKNDLGQSGLYLAAVAGHITIIETLLEHKVDVNSFGGKLGHPLHAACFGGHVKIVVLLLDHGADPKLGPRSAFECAVLANHENIALLLLKGSFDISNQSEYDSILQQSAEAGFADVIQFLQKKYAPLYGDLRSSKHKAVKGAIFKGQTTVVQRYMQKLSDPRVDMPGDAIAIAALGGHDIMISLLVDQGLDLDEEGLLGTPLRAASIMCHESTVRLLLRLGASLHVSRSLGDPLQAAAMQGHESIVRTLLSHGASVNSKGGLYETAIQAAAHRGHQKVVEILLDAGADVHQKGFSRDALHAASEGGHEGIVRFLLERGFKAEYDLPGLMFSKAPPSPYKNVLREASPSRRQEAGSTWGRRNVKSTWDESKDWRERASVTEFSDVVDMIRGVVPSALQQIQPYREIRHRSHNEQNYALRAAAANGHVTVVALLLRELDRMDVPKSEIFAAFKEACENGHDKVVEQLLSDQIEVKDLKEALGAAASKGHLTVVDLLIEHEEKLGLTRVETASINLLSGKRSNFRTWFPHKSSTQETYKCDSTAHTILISGCKGGHLPVFRRGKELVARRCTLVASRHMFREALTTSATNQNFAVFEALLEINSKPDAEDLAEILKLACAWGSEEALQLLLQQDANKVLGVQHHNLILGSATVIDVAGNGFMAILPTLIKRVRPIDSFEKTLGQCLQVASKNGHKEVIEYLIGEGADVNAFVEEARYSSGRNSVFDYDWMYDNHRSIRKISALQAALMGFERFCPRSHHDIRDLQSSWTTANASCQQESIEMLLARGADPNRADEYERYPLNIAAAYCSVEIVQKLISLGANVVAATKDHGTALQAAARREVGGFQIVQVLLVASALVSTTDPGVADALKAALSIFGNPDRNLHQDDGRFQHSASITDVLYAGPGAVVMSLLANLPEEKTTDTRYCLLAQMACMAGDQNCVELLLQHGLDLNYPGYYYGTVLQAASRVGKLKIVQCLVNSGADVNILEGVYGTALRAAANGGHEEIVRYLVANGANVNLSYKDKGESVLHLALKSKSHATFKNLLFSGADLNTEVSNQQHVFISACKDGETELVELLLASGVDANVLGTKPSHYSSMPYDVATPLNAACTGGHLSVVRILLDHGADIENANESSVTPLMAAIRGDHVSVVRILLDAGANVNHGFYNTPLSEAAKDSKLEIVDELLSAGAIIGGPSTIRNALADACSKRQHRTIELLLEALSGSQYEAEICGEAFSAAMKSGDDEILRLLLDNGVSPSFQILRQACAAGVLEVVRMLVETGIDINEDDGDDNPLLHVAASHSKPEIVQFLINRGANVNLHSKKYGSPLMAALEGTMAPFLRSHQQSSSCLSLAKQLPLPEPMHDIYIVGGTASQQKPGYKEVSQCEQIVQILFETGALMDTTVRSFGNALQLASYMGSEVIVRQLLERTEDVNIFGGYFGSPLTAAIKGDHPSIIELLLDQHIDVNWYSPEHGYALHYACAHGSKRLTQSLLDHGADINAYDKKNDSALAAAASPGDDELRMRRSSSSCEEQRAKVELLLRHEPKVQIKECDLLAAASWKYSTDGSHFMSLFLRHDQSAMVTEEIIVKTIQNYNNFTGHKETFPLLLQRDRGLGTTPAMLEAAGDVEVMKILLQHRPLCQVTADVLEHAVKNFPNSTGLVKLLLTHEPQVPVTIATIKAAIGHRYYHSSDEPVLRILLDQNRVLEITDDLLDAAGEARDMEMLLQRRREEQNINSKILENAAKRYPDGPALVSLLLKHDKSVQVTPPVLHAAMSHYGTDSFLKTLFEHDPTLNITQEDLMSLVTSLRSDEVLRKMLNLLFELGKAVEFTADVKEKLDGKFQSRSDQEMKRLFYRLERR